MNLQFASTVKKLSMCWEKLLRFKKIHFWAFLVRVKMNIYSYLIPENITGGYIGMMEVMCCAKVWAKKLEICT